MLFAIISEDIDDSLALRKQTRPRHLARLEQLKSEGKLVLAGPHPKLATTTPGSEGFSGSLVVAEFTSLSEAQQWADQDPYIEAGIYAKVVVKPFIQVLP